MAFVVSHMHRGIKAVEPNLLLLLCHSVAVHTVIPAAGRRQLLFFSSSFFIFFLIVLFLHTNGERSETVWENPASTPAFSFPI